MNMCWCSLISDSSSRFPCSFDVNNVEFFLLYTTVCQGWKLWWFVLVSTMWSIFFDLRLLVKVSAFQWFATGGNGKIHTTQTLNWHHNQQSKCLQSWRCQDCQCEIKGATCRLSLTKQKWATHHGGVYNCTSWFWCMGGIRKSQSNCKGLQLCPKKLKSALVWCYLACLFAHTISVLIREILKELLHQRLRRRHGTPLESPLAQIQTLRSTNLTNSELVD